MKKLFLTSTLTSILFLSACGNADEPAEQNEDETKTEQTVKNDESSKEESQEAANPENKPSDDQIAILENKYDEMTNDGFIESIEAQNDEYTELIVYVSDNFEDINEKGYRSKLEGMGKSIREMTSGVLYNKEQGTLPLIEFRNDENDIIAKFESHTRDERMVFEK